jgi:putative transposase
MKFSKSSLLETIRRKNEGMTTYQARKIAGVSVRRVNQVYTQYLQTDILPELGQNMGRPKKALDQKEIAIVNEFYRQYRVCAKTLEPIIFKEKGLHIPHNKIHKMLIYLGYAKPKQVVDLRKKKWIRYERRHSLTAVHVDWHFSKSTRQWVYLVIDDASRKNLAMIECESPTTELSIEGIKMALKYGQIKQCISDHGAQFTSNSGGNSAFAEFLKSAKIKQILCRIKHPQSNGKAEKFFDLYEHHRHAFESLEKFMIWYNDVRPHMSLDFENLETPSQAFVRKMKQEVI